MHASDHSSQEAEARGVPQIRALPELYSKTLGRREGRGERKKTRREENHCNIVKKYSGAIALS